MKKYCFTILIGLSIFVTDQKSTAEASRKFIYKGSASFVIKPNRVEEFKSAVAKIIRPTKSERGNIEYEAFQVLDQSGKPTNRFEFHELWKSKNAMMIDHKEHAAHMIEFFETIAIGEPNSMVEKFDVSGNEVLPIDAL